MNHNLNLNHEPPPQTISTKNDENEALTMKKKLIKKIRVPISSNKQQTPHHQLRNIPALCRQAVPWWSEG